MRVNKKNKKNKSGCVGKSAKWGDNCGLNGTNGRWEALSIERAHTHTHAYTTTAADAVKCHLSLQARLVGALS